MREHELGVLPELGTSRQYPDMRSSPDTKVPFQV